MRALISVLIFSFCAGTLSAYAEVGSFKVESPTIPPGDCIRVTSYMLGVSKRIDRAWVLPQDPNKLDDLGEEDDDLFGKSEKPVQHRSLKSVVRFTIAKDGTVSNPELTRPSGDFRLDEAAQTAVKAAAPFPRPPDGFSPLVINYTFRPAESEAAHGSLINR